MKRSVHIIILNKKRQLLLQLRDDKPGIVHPGQWGLIGGSVNPGETNLEALNREISEEINSFVNNIKLIYSGIYLKQKILIYTGHLNKKIKDIELTEGQRVEYFNFDELEELDLIPYIKKVIFSNKCKIRC